MDPLAHTLVGAALAETGLRRRTALGATTLMVGANLPDIDAVVSFLGSDASLYYRRGVTHGVVALLVLPWLLAGGMFLLARWLAKQGGPAPDFKWLLLLSYLGVLSHPFLDWLNTYGVRVLSPFSDRWFYGDTLFIIDPWMWLLAACAVVLAHSQVKSSMAGWVVVGLATSALVLSSGIAPWGAMALWCVAVVAIIVVRIRRGPRQDASPWARVCMVALGLYIAVSFGLSRFAELQARTWAEGREWEVEQVMANPLPGHPFARDLVLVLSDRYEFAEVHWVGGRGGGLEEKGTSMPRLPEDNPLVQAALSSPSVRGFRKWLRFGSAQVAPSADGGHRVTLYDVRYARVDGQRAGIGFVQVELDPHGRPR